MREGPLSPARDGVRVAIRLGPRAKADRLVGVGQSPKGRVVRATVTAPAEAGRANEALLRLLARSWAIPRRDLSLVHGPASRNKVVHIAGEPDALMRLVAAMIAGLPDE